MRPRAVVLLAMLLATCALAAGAPLRPLQVTMPRPFVLVPWFGEGPGPVLAVPTGDREEGAPIYRVTTAGGALRLAEAGRLPRGFHPLGLFPAGAGHDAVLLAGRPGRIVIVPPAGPGRWEGAAARPAVDDPRIDPERLLAADLDGDGTDELLLENWTGVLVLRRGTAGAWRRAGWLPLPRAAWVVGATVHVRGQALLPPAGGGPVPRLWARVSGRGDDLRFRGTSAMPLAPSPPAAAPSLEAAVSAPHPYDWRGRDLLLPGDPDRAVLLAGEIVGVGLRARADLLVVPLRPGSKGERLPAPELVAPLDLAVLEDSPLLARLDVDADGTADLVVTGRARGHRGRVVSVFVARGLGGGRFAEKLLAWQGRVARDARSLLLRDLDGDGRPDLLATGEGLLVLWRAHGTRPGELPWARKPDRTWKLPGDDTRPDGSPRILEQDGRRWLVLPVSSPGRDGGALLAFPLS